MSGKVLHYFAGGNTAKGYFSLYESAVKDLSRVFLLQGGSRAFRSEYMKSISESFLSAGHSIEYLHCPSHNEWIDGFIIPKAGIGIFDHAVPDIRSYISVESLQVIVLEHEMIQLSANYDAIGQLTADISTKFEQAYETFAASLKAHDDIEDIYIANMDFTKANQLTNDLIDLFYGEEKAGKPSDVKHRFLGAATPDGAVDFIQNLTEDIEKRYFIKGRAGSGKSTMLKKIAAAGEERGFDVEVYHCGFDPNSLDMVILRELSIAIFDSTAPHEYEPERQADEIIDMYENCITPGTDERFALEIQRTTKAYKDKMKEAISYLAEAKKMIDQLEDLKGEKPASHSVDFHKMILEELK
ncbi:PRK06851 family protein [Metabacillus idriensis]|uniref:PRK06851 family protein n=1 Tax=Metabacillus idriensis TaxID=324768 RepID=UPI003D284CE3